MLHIGLNNHSYIIDDREMHREGISYSIDTIRSIIEDYVDGKIYLIIGSDALPSLHKWKNFLKIISLCNIIVIPRMSDDNEPIINNQVKSYFSKDLAIPSLSFISSKGTRELSCLIIFGITNSASS